MFGSGYFIPQPPINISSPIPDSKFGSLFYNPGRAQNGAEELKTFTSSLAEIFKFMSNSEDSETITKIEEEVREFNFRDYVGDIDMSADYSESLANGSTPGDELIDILMAADSTKKTLEEKVFNSIGGERLNKAKQMFRDWGTYDSQILFPLFDSYCAVFSEIGSNKDSVISRTESYIDGQGSAGLEDLCHKLGVASKNDDDKNKQALKDYVNGVISDLTSFRGFDPEALEEIHRSQQVNAVTPAIGMIGTNIAGGSMARVQHDNYKLMKESAEEAEIDEKRSEAKHEAKVRSEAKQAMMQSSQNIQNMLKPIKNQRRGSI